MTETNIKIKKLLDNVGKEVEKSNEIAQLKGENFNIFSILDLEKRENKTHSNFLVALLNPQGEHGLGNIFLKLFVDMVLSDESRIALKGEKRKIVEDLMQDRVIVVETEIYLGEINSEEIKGGRVDISIQCNTGKIYIENKINAKDQKEQIARYVNTPESVVFYLTLFGSEPTPESRGNNKVNEDFFLLSYKTDITNWLIKCHSEASDYPIVRETIKQYLILIKDLTGQLTTQEMEKETINLILKSKTSFEAAKAIANSFNDALTYKRDSIIEEMRIDLIINGNELPTYILKDEKPEKQSFFIKVIDLVHLGKNYDIGVNVELNNRDYAYPIYYFCVIDNERKRRNAYNAYFAGVFQFTRNNLRNGNRVPENDNAATLKLNRIRHIDFASIESAYFDLQKSSNNEENIGSLFHNIAEEVIEFITISNLINYEAPQ